jgi:ABC-type transport system involved in multi-copper enzyme maturation permease subunit
MNVSSSAPAIAPVPPNLWHAFGGVWRLTARRSLTLGHWLALGGALAVLALICVGALAPQNGPKHYIDWVIAFYVTFLVPVVTFITAGSVMRDEMKPGTVDYVLTRPVPRVVFVAFKYSAHVICAQIDCLIAFALVIALGVFWHAPGIAAAIPSLLLAQVIIIIAFAALGFACGTLTSRYVVVGLLYSLVIELGVGQIPTQLSRLSMTRQVKAMLQPLVAGQSAPFTPSLEVLPATSRLTVIALLVLFSLVLLGLAAAVYWTRELTNASDT